MSRDHVCSDKCINPVLKKQSDVAALQAMQCGYAQLEAAAALIQEEKTHAEAEKCFVAALQYQGLSEDCTAFIAKNFYLHFPKRLVEGIALLEKLVQSEHPTPMSKIIFVQMLSSLENPYYSKKIAVLRAKSKVEFSKVNSLMLSRLQGDDGTEKNVKQYLAPPLPIPPAIVFKPKAVLESNTPAGRYKYAKTLLTYYPHKIVLALQIMQELADENHVDALIDLSEIYLKFSFSFADARSTFLHAVVLVKKIFQNDVFSPEEQERILKLFVLIKIVARKYSVVGYLPKIILSVPSEQTSIFLFEDEGIDVIKRFFAHHAKAEDKKDDGGGAAAKENGSEAGVIANATERLTDTVQEFLVREQEKAGLQTRIAVLAAEMAKLRERNQKMLSDAARWAGEKKESTKLIADKVTEIADLQRKVNESNAQLVLRDAALARARQESQQGIQALEQRFEKSEQQFKAAEAAYKTALQQAQAAQAQIQKELAAAKAAPRTLIHFYTVKLKQLRQEKEALQIQAKEREDKAADQQAGILKRFKDQLRQAHEAEQKKLDELQDKINQGSQRLLALSAKLERAKQLQNTKVAVAAKAKDVGGAESAAAEAKQDEVAQSAAAAAVPATVEEQKVKRKQYYDQVRAHLMQLNNNIEKIKHIFSLIQAGWLDPLINENHALTYTIQEISRAMSVEDVQTLQADCRQLFCNERIMQNFVLFQKLGFGFHFFGRLPEYYRNPWLYDQWLPGELAVYWKDLKGEPNGLFAEFLKAVLALAAYDLVINSPRMELAYKVAAQQIIAARKSQNLPVVEVHSIVSLLRALHFWVISHYKKPQGIPPVQHGALFYPGYAAYHHNGAAVAAAAPTNGARR